MPIRDLFASDVTRDIPPVVYFHEQSAEKLRDEVAEYIVTGGWPAGHPGHARVPDGIHEQYVRLLRNVAAELGKPGGPELPAVWISGMYGSGKSSFAKLLGLALDGAVMPDGRPLAEAWLARDTSPLASELREAWDALRQRIDPVAVVFDLGAAARDDEHLHAAVLRQVAARLGYCRTEASVAEFELALERDGQWARFEEVAQRTLGRPWAEARDRALAEEDFSLVMSAMFPDRYTDPMSWFASRSGTRRGTSPEEAARAIGDMLAHRRPGATLFVVVDEVSQYVRGREDRVDRLRAFVSALGSALRGRAWLFALGQQQLEEEVEGSFLTLARDRFPRHLRAHLSPANIRDVVHERLLRKTPAAIEALGASFEAHRAELRLYAYGCAQATPEELVALYPLLPGHIDLLLQITSALRARSSRTRGDAQAIRGLLQLLGELFRAGLAERSSGALVSLDLVYDVLQSAIEPEAAAGMARVLEQCADDPGGTMARVAKAVALLELVSDTLPTDAALVARCLLDRVDRGDLSGAVAPALEELRRRNLLGYTERRGYKLQSPASEAWERERRDVAVPAEAVVGMLAEALRGLLALPDAPRMQSRSFPWAGMASDGGAMQEAALLDRREGTAVRVDFRLLLPGERSEADWVRRSAEVPLCDRIVWVCGDDDRAREVARELGRSRAMVRRHEPRRESLGEARRGLLVEEEGRIGRLEALLRQRLAEALMIGRLYFRGRGVGPRDCGPTFEAALSGFGTSVLAELFPHFVPHAPAASEVLGLLDPELSAPSPGLLPDGLGILERDGGRYVPACSGVVPGRILERIEAEGGVGGAELLARFGGPPYGYAPSVVKACVAGLLRAGRVRVLPAAGAPIASVRDAGVRELFERDRLFRSAVLSPAEGDDIGFRARARICRLFEEIAGLTVEREDDAIADAAAQVLPDRLDRLRAVQQRLAGLPAGACGDVRRALGALGDAIEPCIARSRHTADAVRLLRQHLDTLREGLSLLSELEAELTEEAAEAVRAAAALREHPLAQLAPTPAGQDLGAQQLAERLDALLASDRPWRELGGIAPELERIRAAYAAERRRRLAWQERQAALAGERLRARPSFARLDAERAHALSRGLVEALTDTSADELSPPLDALEGPFLLALDRAERAAHERLDALAGRIRPVDLALRHAEIGTREEADALIEEIRARIEAELAAGARIRLV